MATYQMCPKNDRNSPGFYSEVGSPPFRWRGAAGWLKNSFYSPFLSPFLGSQYSTPPPNLVPPTTTLGGCVARAPPLLPPPPPRDPIFTANKSV